MLSGCISAVILFASLFPQSHTGPPAQAAFRISGTVVNALDGRPVPQTEVTIAAMREQGRGQTILTGDDGRFAFENMAPGKYGLTARRRGFSEQAYLQHGQFATAIAVGSGLESENIIFPLLPSASISGYVGDESNDPIRNAQVILFVQGTGSGTRKIGVRDQQSTDDTGAYHFNHLDPGTYYVASSAQPWYAQSSGAIQSAQNKTIGGTETGADRENALDVAYAITFFGNATDISEAEGIPVKAGDKAEADIQLLPVRALHVGIRNSIGNSAERFAGIQVSKIVVDGFKINVPSSVTSSGSEISEIDGLAPGEYELSISSQTEGIYTSETKKVNLSSDTALDLEPNRAAPRVKGTVKIEGFSTARGGISVTLQDKDTGSAQSAQTSADGTFGFENNLFAAGRYEVSVGSPNNLVVRTISATGAKVSGESIEIDGTSVVALTLVLSPAVPSVDGVVLRDGKPVAGVMVVMVPQYSEDNLSLFRRDQSDSDGSFSLGYVIPGKYTVVAIEDGWNLEWANPAVILKYLPGGVVVKAETEGKYNLRVNVQ